MRGQMGHRCITGWKKQHVLTIWADITPELAEQVRDTYTLDGDKYPEPLFNPYAWSTVIKVTEEWLPDGGQSLPTPGNECVCAPKPVTE